MSLAERIAHHTRTEGQHLIWDGFLLQGRYPTYCYRDELGVARTLRVVRFNYEARYGGLGRRKLLPGCHHLRCVSAEHHQLPTTTRQLKSRTRRMKNILHQRADLIRQLSEQGFNNKEIADSLGMANSTVARLIKKGS